MTGHGFRAMARTLLDEELKFRPDIIGQQLAHVQRDPNGRAYNRTKHLEERREMMQRWADFLDELREAASEAKLSASRAAVVAGKAAGAKGTAAKAGAAKSGAATSGPATSGPATKGTAKSGEATGPAATSARATLSGPERGAARLARARIKAAEARR